MKSAQKQQNNKKVDDLHIKSGAQKPKCSICKKPMKNSIDSITGKISKYLWQTDCEHNNKLRLSIG